MSCHSEFSSPPAAQFVPNLTFGPELIKACRKYTKTSFETQLMVSNYNCDSMLEEYVEATKGPNGEPGVVIVHVEANVHLHRTLSNIRQMGGSPSVALNPHTPAEMIENVLDLVDRESRAIRTRRTSRPLLAPVAPAPP